MVQPPVCSARTATDPATKAFCSVKPLPHGRHEVKVHLTAQSATIDIAGYQVLTENYNAAYLTPVVEVMPGDTVAAQLINRLEPRKHNGTVHGDDDLNPTNLHYFHGGIVSPHNAWPGDVELGTGDNVYVHLIADPKAVGPSNTFEFSVPIPGDHKLDARVLEGTGYISHPLGLNWYHSHMHGISSDQVMGGMSGLLSVGEATANVKAACVPPRAGNHKCANNVDQDTADLRRRTDIRYVLLRDIALQNIHGRPDEPGHTTAEWAPTDRNFPEGASCGAWDGKALNATDPKLRLGFCQKTLTTAWLFTLNGQRFPTITLAGNRNALLRIGNVSANIGYWLELYNEADGSTVPLTVLSVDGVVPARPINASEAKVPVQANTLDHLLLMPASRVELYIRNDLLPHTTPQSYVLRTKNLRGIGTDEWPEIQLARIDLEANAATSKVVSGLNALVATPPPAALPIVPTPTFVAPAAVEPPAHSPGCVRDLNRAANEYRRVTFLPGTPTPLGEATWAIKTEIVSAILAAPDPPLIDEEGFKTDPSAAIQGADGLGVPFEDYVGADHRVNWSKPHVCIEIDHGSHVGSHKQLWVLSNSTGNLHNFHIHQMKFRVATKDELENTYHMRVPDAANTCDIDLSGPPQPEIKCYEPVAPDMHDPKALPLWHDTIPLPPGSRVYVIMSFDAKEQVGRFVFHCHILKHEDKGLMAPIEVWAPRD
jgi:FtsP/CotA-like multicopper oxidase with cupredoxin domain